VIVPFSSRIPCTAPLILGADRRDHPIGAYERIDRQQPEVRRRVDYHLLVGVEHRFERGVQEPLAAELADQAHLNAGERACGWDHVDAMHIGDDHVLCECAAGEDVDEVDARAAVAETELAGERALRVGIDNECAQALTGEQYADVDRGRGLPHAAFLVCDRGGCHDTLLLIVGCSLTGALARCGSRQITSCSGGEANRRWRPACAQHREIRRSKRLCNQASIVLRTGEDQQPFDVDSD
jgi:hypothetical protein